MLNEFFNGDAGGGAGPATPKDSIKSLRFNSGDSAYLEKSSFGTPTNADVYTVSMWVKQAAAARGSNQYLLQKSGGGGLLFTSGGILRWEGATSLDSPGGYYDNAAWMHVLLVSSSSSSRELFRNGESVNTASDSGQLGGTGALSIGSTVGGGFHFDGLIAEVYFVDGQALTVDDFTLLDDDGKLRPKDYTGSFGSNGLYLPFSDNTNTTTIAQDDSGNSNDFTANNISVTAGAGNDSLVDSPSRNGTDTGVGGEVFGNYATLDPYALSGGGGVLENGNLEATLLGNTSGPLRQRAHSTIATASGKWYFEATLVSATNATSPGDFTVGIASPGYSFGDFRQGTIQYRPALGVIRQNNSNLATGLSNIAVGDVIGIAYDVDNSTFAAYVNGTLEASVTFNLYSGPFRPFIVNEDTPSNSTLVGAVNFGQRPFAYTAPSGFKAICSTNLADPAIADSEAYVSANAYTGDGTTSNAVTGVGFEPDLLWVKGRSTRTPYLVDAIRGGNKLIPTHQGNTEQTSSNAVQSFDADGFTVGSGNQFNANGEGYAAWAWYTSGSDVSNTDGSIGSNVRADTTAGFSIVTYTGTGASATVGHGLGAAPEMYIIKCLNNTETPRLFTTAIDGSLDTLVLTDTGSKGNSSITLPTSTVFSLDNTAAINGNSLSHIAYCWTSIPGFSSFGFYRGNGSTDGTMVNVGFRPAVVYIKNSTSNTAHKWYMSDNKRDGLNDQNYYVATNDTTAEVTSNQALYLLSNGFKITTSDNAFNQNNTNIFYAAWAENPFKTALAR